LKRQSPVEAQLHDNGIKPTPQRVEVARLLLSTPCHLSAEQILRQLRTRGSGISKATVYNTLNLLSDHGIIRQVVLDPTRIMYDSTPGPHHHFYNEDTGELTDVDAAGLEIRGLPDVPAGTIAESVELIIRVRSKG